MGSVARKGALVASSRCADDVSPSVIENGRYRNDAASSSALAFGPSPTTTTCSRPEAYVASADAIWSRFAAAFPGSIESHFAAVKDAKEQSSLYLNSDEVVAWYERDFSVPEDVKQSFNEKFQGQKPRLVA